MIKHLGVEPPPPAAPVPTAPAVHPRVHHLQHLPAMMCPKCPPPKTVVIYKNTPAVQTFYGLVSAAAMGVSYSKNQSVPWALLHGLIGPAYLFYVGAQAWEQRQQSRGSSAWWGGTVRRSLPSAYGTKDLDVFEAQDRDDAYEKAEELAHALSWSEEDYDYADVQDDLDIEVWEQEDPRLKTLGGLVMPS